MIGAVWSGTARVGDLLPGASGVSPHGLIGTAVELQGNVILVGGFFYPAYREGPFSMSAARRVATLRCVLEKS
ncbi:MAG TPA: hypothetical protein DEG13_11885, partial [Candidatus Microthrix parvicella]|nr:hypothetical protein [Candidatus Microthrix parvicella]